MRVSKESKLRRQEIIDTASHLFKEQGILETSMAIIAREIGVAKGLLYYYFETKEQLVQAVIVDKCQQHVVVLKENWYEYPSFYDRFMLLMDSYYGVYPYKLKEKYLNLNLELGISFHTVYLDMIKDELADLVSQGEHEHILKVEYPKEMIMMTLEGMFSILNIQSLSLDTIAVLVAQSLNLKVKDLRTNIQTLPLVYLRKE